MPYLYVNYSSINLPYECSNVGQTLTGREDLENHYSSLPVCTGI